MIDTFVKKVHFPETFPVTCHTQHVGPYSTFVAIKGMKDDGTHYIHEALQKGARVIVIEKDVQLDPLILELIEWYKAQFLVVDNTRLALAHMSAQTLDFPAKKLKFMGITGTKGKTTTAFLAEHLLKTAGYKTALLSTVKNRILNTDLSASLTTPQPDYLHVFFNICLQAGVEWVVMEVAAQALTLHRVEGIDFDLVIFTNFSQEHGEFYATQDDYFAAKAQLLKQLKSTGIFIANADDDQVMTLTAQPNKFLYSIDSEKVDLRLSILENTLKGLKVLVKNTDTQTEFLCPQLVGHFNAYNIASAIAGVQQLSLNKRVITQALFTFPGVPGRLNSYKLPNGATAFIDYAHNPASYEAVLSTLRAYTSRLIVLFGGGGDRDQLKRPIMGKIAAHYADVIILTSDNPRSEDPQQIIQHIQAGIDASQRHKILVELDRENAIHMAYKKSNPESIIVLLGKGPDEYQLIKDIKYPFSEAAILKSL
ncbi:MAG: UDP-N-acetylmuramoyl-L-alanyl-D-glutamate--2,6-diaminopimelate ligase [Candidatus Babeliaceae bacterium]